jgi:CRP/FNR family transcriptional regulator
MIASPTIRAVPFDDIWPSDVSTELLNDRQRHTLASMAKVRIMPARSVLYEEGTHAGSVFLLANGVMKCYRELRSGKRRVMSFLFPSDVLGLAERGRYVNTAATVTTATVYCIPVETLKESFRRDVQLQFHFLCKVTHELRQSQRQLMAMARRDAPGRVAMFIESMRRNAVLRDDHRAGLVWLPMSRTDIASFLGLTPESLSRAFSRLTRGGIVTFTDRHHVRIDDGSKLHALADPP